MGAYGSPELYPYNNGKNSYKPRKPKKSILKNVIAIIFVIAVVFYLYNFTDTFNSTAVSVNSSNTINYNQFQKVGIGDTISSGNTEYTLANVSLTNEIVADWAEVKQVHKASGNNTIIQLDINIKNTGTQNITCGKGLVCQAFYDNGQYKYSGAWVIKDATKGFITSDSEEILPLETKSIILAIEIPEEVKDGDKDLYVVFGPKENPLIYNIK